VTKQRRVSWKAILSVVVSVGVAVLVLTQLDVIELRRTLEGASLPWLGVGLVMYLLNYILRTLRFRQLLPTRQISFAQLFSVSSLYGVFLYLLPGKSGEITLPAMLKLRQGVNVSESTALLVVARFYDLLSVALFLPLVLLAFRERIPGVMFYSALIFVALMVPVGVGYFVWLRRGGVEPPTAALESGIGWIAKTRRWMGRMIGDLHLLACMKGQGWLLLNTIAIWLCVYTNFYFLAASLGYWLEFGQVVVLSILMIPLTLLPVQGVANLGAHEIGWTAAFAIFSYPTEHALTIAIGTHAFLLIEVLLLGLFGWCVGQIADCVQKKGQEGHA
jgi:uncharacterized membrane protein YbhN (UPF0104 family)